PTTCPRVEAEDVGRVEGNTVVKYLEHALRKLWLIAVCLIAAGCSSPSVVDHTAQEANETADQIAFVEPEALRRVRVAAEQGDPNSQYELGQACAEGKGVEPNYQEAAKWLRFAAEQGEPRAQFDLAAMYDAGTGVPQDFVLRHKWHILAASRVSGERQRQFAHIRDRFGAELPVGQEAEAQRLAREWKPKTWEELKPKD
ncbi:MAG: tetratricopeptide repeat protein, partial [Acidobacteria bacterium]|nr:tetratricopeptide repeat protein [Acidobacteriota bacterium]